MAGAGRQDRGGAAPSALRLPAAAPDPRAAADVTIDEVAALLRSRGERMTGPRRAVLTVLAEGNEHLSADAVLTRVAAHDAGVHRASVYRTLDALCDLGVVQHVHVGHGGTAYHLVREGQPHLHAQCGSCGAVHDLPADLLDDVSDAVYRLHGFRLDAGHVALSGLCRSCDRSRS